MDYQPASARPAAGQAPSLLGSCAGMENLRAAISKVAAADAPVLIVGEVGTGKELVARQIHAQSQRAPGPFIAVNCAALPLETFESEVFGTGESGGAVGWRREVARLHAAHGGTLFLDEIADLAPAMQAILLRFLESGATMHGGTGRKNADVRLITATHQDLATRIASRQFREDLYYRLNALQLEVPPLRERGDDADQLADFFLAQFDRQHGSRGLRFDESARQQLRQHGWPGNIRELHNRIMQAVLMCEGDRVDRQALGFPPAPGERSATVDVSTARRRASDRAAVRSAISLREKRQLAERAAITEALRASEGQVPAAAAALGISRAQLYRLIGSLRVKHRPYDTGPPPAA